MDVLGGGGGGGGAVMGWKEELYDGLGLKVGDGADSGEIGAAAGASGAVYLLPVAPPSL